jgi:rubrerythrin
MARVVVGNDAEEICALFTGEMIEIEDPFTGKYRVPGWRCKQCSWLVGAQGKPPPHECPEAGEKQRERANAA